MGGSTRRFLPVIGPIRLVMLFSLVLVIFYNSATWKALNSLVPLPGLNGFAFFASFAVFLCTAFILLLTLVSFRPLLKPVLALVALCSAGATYFMGSYGISIDTVIVQNVFETNTGEASDLFNRTLVSYLLVLGVLPSVLIWLWPVRYQPFFRGLLNKILVIIGCLLVAIVMVGRFYSTYATIFREEDKLTHFINPTNYIYAVGKYAKQRLVIKAHPLVEPIGLDAHYSQAARQREKKALLVFVVGETARADHFSLNGYARETNPGLKERDIINFTQVHSCGTSTVISVPCMFSQYLRKDYSNRKAQTHEGLLDILQRAGVQVLWLENNSDCKGTCLRVPNRDIPKTQPSLFCDGRNCLDESLLVSLPEYINGLKNSTIIVLHSNGSHGPEYYERYPKDMERFQPICRTNQLGNCTREELVNVYDNTILYTDHFLSKVIELLQCNADKFDTAMIYVSDHGESLGENGVYLHAAPYAIAPEAQTHVPMIMWFSPNALYNWGIRRSCLEAKYIQPDLSHDNLFHSVLGLLDVQTSLYQPQLDIFASCRTSVIR